MKKREPVSTIMTESVLTCDLNNPEIGLKDARDILEQNDIRHLPVVHGDNLKGIISMTDIQRISFGGNFGQGEVDDAIFDMLSIERVMSHDVKAVEKDTTIREVAEMLGEGEFNALPVLEDNKLVGIVTTTDLINYLLEQY